MLIDKLITEKIQEGLHNANIDQKQEGLICKNHPWVANYNHIFDRIERMKDDNDNLIIVPIYRNGYKIPCIIDVANKSLYTILGKSSFRMLSKKYNFKKPHYSYCLCLKSKHEGEHTQIELFDNEIKAEEIKGLYNLLEKLTAKFPDVEIIDYYIIECEFDHRKCQLINITANQMTKNYEVLKSSSWNQYIYPDYDVLKDEEKNRANKESNEEKMNVIKIKLKDNFKENLSEDNTKNV